MNLASAWSLLRVITVLLFGCGVSRSLMAVEETTYPRIQIADANHTALTGDLTVFVVGALYTRNNEPAHETQSASNNATSNKTTNVTVANDTVTLKNPLTLRVLFLDGYTSESVGELSVVSSTSRDGKVTVIIPCGYFARGGSYTLQLEYKSPTTVNSVGSDGKIKPEFQVSSALDVKWPTPTLNVEPREFETYTSLPVHASLVYEKITCVALSGSRVTEYVLQLVYCGSSVVSCDPQYKNRVQVLYREEVRGFSSSKLTIDLKCEYFGLAGNYALRLKPADANPSAPITSIYLKVDWSSKFIFNVHARSVYPCEGTGGVSVLFEYPSCRLQGDRVRLYARLRADVASLDPPSSLHYVAELKAPVGRHSLTFNCDVFTEKFIEYCFVYVSQAITGAMAEVKLSCIPTFPVRDGDAGGWGPWSPWTPCSSSCVGGTRTRYRFCDTPPPKYGAKFCQGKAVETESCGGSNHLDLDNALNAIDWECQHGTELAAVRPEVTAQVGSKCRCGCSIEFHDDSSRRILAASTQACPGRSFWLLQAPQNYVVRLHLDQTRFPCPNQYLIARDGDSRSSNLLIDIAFDHHAIIDNDHTIISTGRAMLLEFFSDEVAAAGESCVGGYLAHADVLRMQNITMLMNYNVNATNPAEWIFRLTPAHLAAASLLILVFLISLVLALQYAFRYRKYHIAKDLDNTSEISMCSESTPKGVTRRPRAMSSSTLISEVVSLVRLNRDSPKHAKLKTAAGEFEDGYESSETQAEFEEEITTGSITPKARDVDETSSQKTIIPNIAEDLEEAKLTPAQSIYSGSIGQLEVKYARPVKLKTLESSNTSCEENSSVEKNEQCATESSLDCSVKEPESKESSPNSANSSTTTLRSGKDTKDRRNREKLLQGPGSSEFSLTNVETDLELDYYDYNVANASAVPGSYLGMDPAFLIWIPPLSDKNDENSDSEAADRERLVYELEGASLSPAEYRRTKCRQEETKFITDASNAKKKSEYGESSENNSSDDSNGEGHARLSERLLPIHRILEDSRIRVSEESLSSHLRNRNRNSSKSGDSDTEISPEKSNMKFESLDTKYSKGGNVGEPERRNDERNPTTTKTPQQTLTKPETPKNSNQEERRARKFNQERRPRTDGSPKFPILRKLRQDEKKEENSKAFIANLRTQDNASLESSEKNNIPMYVLPSNKSLNKSVEKIQSPDYGVGEDLKDESKESFYDLLRECEDSIKFADDDEYVDNKIVA